MIRAIVVISIFFFLSQVVRAQPGADTIHYRYSFWGNRINYEGKNVHYWKLQTIMGSDEEAEHYLHRSKVAAIIATGLNVTGVTAALVYGFSSKRGAVDGGLFIELGTLAASVPLGIIFRHNMKKAISIYNGSAQSVGYTKPPMELNFAVTGNGVGLAINF